MLFYNSIYFAYLPIRILTLLLLTFNCVNGELTNKDHQHNKEAINLNNRQSRVLDAIDDQKWHVSHLKDMKFDTDCQKATLEDKVKKYRDTLRNDGALVEFVSADKIPVNEIDVKRNVCKSNFTRRLKSKNEDKAPVEQKKKTLTSGNEMRPATVSIKDKILLEDNVSNINSTSNNRRSEYQFSSVEYYDETQDFSADACPDAIEIIELELDTLRSYDIVCEATLEWRSLE